jgi:DNA-binding phage protein
MSAYSAKRATIVVNRGGKRSSATPCAFSVGSTRRASKRNRVGAKALLDEAATLFLSGEPDTARLILRDLVNATLGFERLSKATATPSKSLHRMLSPKGNPSMDNLAAIFDAIRKCLKVSLKAHTVNLQKVA